jgi:prolyl 4-hydroxylase
MMMSKGSSLLRCGFLFISAFYMLQTILLLNLDPCVTKNSVLPVSLSCNNAEHESNAVIRSTIATPTTASNKVESQVTLPKADDVGSDLGVPQVVPQVAIPQVTIDVIADSAAIRDRLDRARIYINDVVAVNKTYDKVRDTCKNTDEVCAFYAVKGQCDVLPTMPFRCAPVCESCEKMDFDLRCKMDPDAVDALYPDDLDRLYESITTNPAFEEYGLRILSRPSYAPGDTAETTDYQLGPWLVVFDNALTDQEADRFVELGSKVGYKQSVTNAVGKKEKDGTIHGTGDIRRTSTTAWCQLDCAEDPTVRGVTNRIATITGIAETNFEAVQILKYEEGQFYKVHNDYVRNHKVHQPGVRILTFYFYLSDVDEGGGTHFPKLNLTVAPKKGRAVLWVSSLFGRPFSKCGRYSMVSNFLLLCLNQSPNPQPSVLNDDPNSRDDRTDHEALAVNRGVKFGFNAWIHQRDFQTPFERACH